MRTTTRSLRREPRLNRGRIADPTAGRSRGRHRALVIVAGVGAYGAILVAGMSSPAAAATPSPPPSAIGNENADWIQVASNYEKTGFALASTLPKGSCSSECHHLWVTHDGGASWHLAKSAGWDGGRPVIAVDRRGHDVLYSDTSSALVRSDDWGDTWVKVGPAGEPAVSPGYASDGTVAVAVPTGGDYLLHDSGQATIPGSGGAVYDFSFVYMPTYPANGGHAPVLLTGEDTKQRLPVIQRCTAAYVCTGTTTLPGAVYFSSPVTLLPSSTYADDATVFAQSGRGIYKSTDGGLTFTPLAIGDPSATATSTPMLALAPGYGGPVKTAWAAVFQIFQDRNNPKNAHAGGGLFRTDDGGATWHAQAAPGFFDQGAQSVAVAPDGRLFAGYVSDPATGLSGLACSTDGGKTWRASCPTVGDASNDPGPVPGTTVRTCTTCTVAPGTHTVAPAAAAGASASPGLVGAASSSASRGDPSAGPVGAEGPGGGGGRPWATPLMIVAVLLALIAVGRAVTRRWRTRSSQ